MCVFLSEIYFNFRKEKMKLAIKLVLSSGAVEKPAAFSIQVSGHCQSS